MNKCLRVSFPCPDSSNFLRDFIQKHARKLELEGTAQLMPGGQQVNIFVCGSKNEVDAFIDVLHKGTAKVQFFDIVVEPFVKVKDYRGVFRIIE